MCLSPFHQVITHVFYEFLSLCINHSALYTREHVLSIITMSKRYRCLHDHLFEITHIRRTFAAYSDTWCCCPSSFRNGSNERPWYVVRHRTCGHRDTCTRSPCCKNTIPWHRRVRHPLPSTDMTRHRQVVGHHRTQLHHRQCGCNNWYNKRQILNAIRWRTSPCGNNTAILTIKWSSLLNAVCRHYQNNLHTGYRFDLYCNKNVCVIVIVLTWIRTIPIPDISAE